MLTTNRTANISGQSNVGDAPVAYLGANIQSDGSISISISISDVSLYSKNKTAVDADIKTFQDNAIASAQGGIA